MYTSIGKDSESWFELFSEAESRLCQKILSYKELDDSWDNYGEKAPSSDAADDALSFLANKPIDIPLPFPECGTAGDLGLYWDYGHQDVFTQVSVEGDGTYAYFTVHGVPGGIVEKSGVDGIDVTEPWPSEMLEILRIKKD